MKKLLMGLLATAATLTPAFSDDAYIRIQSHSVILFAPGGGDGSPGANPSNPVSIVAPEAVSARIFAPTTITILATGATAADAIEVTGLPPGLTFSRTSNGAGNISGSPASAGSSATTVTVRRPDNSVAATKTVAITIADSLAAQVAATGYEVDVGGSLEVSPTVSGAIGTIVWSHDIAMIPDGLVFDELTGTISGSPTSPFSIPEVLLTAVDQFDLAVASTDQFSLSAKAVCGPWSNHPAPQANNWYAVTYGAGKYVAVAGSGTNRAMTSPDGTSWTLGTMPANNWTAVAFGDGQFVATSTAGVASSANGSSWTARTAPSSSWRSVAYGAGTFVAVADNGTNRVATSADGVSWIGRTAPAKSWMSVTYGNGIFVALTFDGFVMTSPNGVTWTETADLPNLASVTFAGDRFIALGAGLLYQSVDGVTWTAGTVPAGNWQSVAWGNGRYVAVATNSLAMSSQDGSTWTLETAPEAINSRTVTYGGGRFIALGYSGTNRIMLKGC